MKVITETEDYCMACFDTLEPFPGEYRIMNYHDIAMFEPNWSA